MTVTLSGFPAWPNHSLRCLFDLLPSGLTIFSLVMFITAEDDEHEKAIFRRADHQHFEGGR
ncbi:hypothetical protein, partial [Marinobacter changyiensis]|uniref:hypothetical protein n=1 Tax=Marinobacter changyiensis TaxID=2604091 RepID=UPI001C55393F